MALLQARLRCIETGSLALGIFPASPLRLAACEIRPRRKLPSPIYAPAVSKSLALCDFNENQPCFKRSEADFWPQCRLFPPLRADFCQRSHAREVVDRNVQHEHLVHLLQPAHHHLAHTPQTLSECVGAAHNLGESGGPSIEVSRALRDDVIQRCFSSLLETCFADFLNRRTYRERRSPSLYRL